MSPTAIVGYDGDEPSRAALLWAMEETDPGWRVLAVCVLGHEDPPVPLASLLPRMPGVVTRTSEHAVREWVVDGEGIGDVVDLRMERGHPAEVLARVADREGAELIVVGHRRGRQLEQARASVARHLLQHSPCPVVVVP